MMGLSDFPALPFTGKPREEWPCDLLARDPAEGARLAGFDLPLGSLSPYMQAGVQELIDGGGLDVMIVCGQVFVCTSDIVHFTSGDWEPG